MMGHDTAIQVGVLAALGLGAALVWLSADKMAAAARREAEALRLLTEARLKEEAARKIAKAMLEAFALWNYGARDEAIQTIRDAGIKVEEMR